ncbi:2'-5'-oligoadenylate synthase 2 [Apodemus speciosus]|uniref:2'-5'-oligoadenylate synthase 2 n=1 Tax=Apodemus speciosus TaxID=105296 RepID=A0ABQ0ET77_APOSI
MENWRTSWSFDWLSDYLSGWLSGGSPKVSFVPAHKLEEYIEANLKPNEASLKQIDQAVDTISDLLRNEIPGMEVAKGGSYGRGTVLRGCSDGTLALFMNCFQQFQDQKKSQDKLLDTVEQWLKSYEKYRKSVNRGHTLEVQMSVPGQSISLQLVPAFNPLYGFGKNPSSQVYRNLKRSMDQEQFFKKYPRRLKDLILLIKHWYEQCQEKWALTPQSLLYALELLTVYAWEQGCQAEKLRHGTRCQDRAATCQSADKSVCLTGQSTTTLRMRQSGTSFCTNSTPKEPVILDPTDPTNNVGKDAGYWQILAEKAQAWLYSPSLNNESPPPYWNVLRCQQPSLVVSGYQTRVSSGGVIQQKQPGLRQMEPVPLFATPSHLLDKFIEDFLQPNKVSLDQIKSAVDIICSFLKENCFRNSDTKVLKTVKGGSTAKGTALKQGSDADIVVFLSSLNRYDSLRTQRTQFVQEIQKQLKACQQALELEVKFEISKWSAPRVLSFTLKSKSLNESVEFDVLPAYDALECWVNYSLASPLTPKPTKSSLREYASGNIKGGEFSICFTELQKNFVETRPTKLKSLIRLIKHWYKQQGRMKPPPETGVAMDTRGLVGESLYERKMKPKASLPPKYALELLAVYAWEHGSGTDGFKIAEGFRTVLDLVIKCQQLCIF